MYTFQQSRSAMRFGGESVRLDKAWLIADGTPRHGLGSLEKFVDVLASELEEVGAQTSLTDGNGEASLHEGRILSHVDHAKYCRIFWVCLGALPCCANVALQGSWAELRLVALGNM
jgi:hypothetical protein